MPTLVGVLAWLGYYFWSRSLCTMNFMPIHFHLLYGLPIKAFTDKSDYSQTTKQGNKSNGKYLHKKRVRTCYCNMQVLKPNYSVSIHKKIAPNCFCIIFLSLCVHNHYSSFSHDTESSVKSAVCLPRFSAIRTQKSIKFVKPWNSGIPYDIKQLPFEN